MDVSYPRRVEMLYDMGYWASPPSSVFTDIVLVTWVFFEYLHGQKSVTYLLVLTLLFCWLTTLKGSDGEHVNADETNVSVAIEL